jgi:hypothetical protein
MVHYSTTVALAVYIYIMQRLYNRAHHPLLLMDLQIALIVVVEGQFLFKVVELASRFNTSWG